MLVSIRCPDLVNPTNQKETQDNKEKVYEYKVTSQHNWYLGYHSAKKAHAAAIAYENALADFSKPLLPFCPSSRNKPAGIITHLATDNSLFAANALLTSY